MASEEEPASELPARRPGGAGIPPQARPYGHVIPRSTDRTGGCSLLGRFPAAMPRPRPGVPQPCGLGLSRAIPDTRPISDPRLLVEGILECNPRIHLTANPCPSKRGGRML